MTQVIWSPCGRYLYIVERKSEGAMIYDIRKTGQLLGWLEGRKAMTNQRLGVHIASNSRTAGQEVWAGSTDGKMRAWGNPHEGEGAQRPTFEWHGHNGDFRRPVIVSKALILCQKLYRPQLRIPRQRCWQVALVLKDIPRSMTIPRIARSILLQIQLVSAERSQSRRIA